MNKVDLTEKELSVLLNWHENQMHDAAKKLMFIVAQEHKIRIDELRNLSTKVYDPAFSFGPGTNTGHGHVYPRPDGVKARCGGPGICKICSEDFSKSQLLSGAKI